METGLLEHRYRLLRNHLDDLGYRQCLVIECLPLVERLKCSNLELGSEPYKLDNARLVKECNELHLNLLHQQEDAQKAQKGGKKKHIPSKSQPTFELDSPLKPAKSCQEQYWNASAQATDPYIANMVEISEKRISCLNRELNLLREEKNQQAEIIATFKNQKKHIPSKSQPTFELDSPLKPAKSCQEQYWNASAQATDPYIANMVEISEKRISCLNRELNLLREEKNQQAEIIATFKNQLNNRDREIHRLTSMLEGGRPITAIRKDCCCSCKDTISQIDSLTSEVKRLKIRKEELEQEVKDSVANQHEAMTRAVMLAERNKKLEQELRDIDQMALAVEAECNSTVKENSIRVSKIQEKLDNKRGLNNEIERMAQESAMQRRKIADLESQLNSKRTRSETIPEKSSVQRKVRSGKRTKSKSPSLPAAKSAHEYNPKLNPEQYEKLIEKLQEERDFYYQECLKSKEVSANSDNNKEMQWRLNEKEKQLQELKKANQELLKEKQILQTRLNSGPNKESHSTMTSPKAISPTCLDQCSTMSLKTMLKRLEQERDLARSDVMRLEEERDALRERLKIATETQVAEHARLEKTVIESEERVRKLEAERRELLSSQGSKKATISNMENHIESTQTKLVSLQTELSEQRALYNQIKSLQEQTDRALADSQGQLVQAEMELTNARDRVRQLEKERAGLDHEVATLKNEVSVMRGSLAQVDQEKDGLLISIDTKTERIAMLEQELKTKEDRTLKLEENLTEVKKKLR
ncbi:hypothetical protein C0J52_07358 [Blattella germanica]|nr:hypothetical protein C0J52_07358 [Blattella germanica]